MPVVLIVENDVQMQKLLKIALESHGYYVTGTEDAKEGLASAIETKPDMILLDLGLAGKDGLPLLKRLREWYTGPIIILSAQHSEANIITALDNGANDYLTKPFRTDELLFRMHAAMRNTKRHEVESLSIVGELEIDLSKRTVKRNGELLNLTPTEYSLLALFTQHQGRVLTQQYLLREIWGIGYINQSQYLRAYIAELRKKVERDPNSPALIVTQSGIGYRFIGTD